VFPTGSPTGFDVPRAVLLASWGTAALRGEVSPEHAARWAFRADDEVDGDAVDVAEVLTRLLAEGVPGFRVVLPVAGDPLGLPGPAAFNALACEAGECVIATGPATAASSSRPAAGTLALVPQVLPFGSDLEPGVVVGWHEHPVALRPAGGEALAGADRALRTGLRKAADVLTELDVARWRPEAAERWADLRSAQLDARLLPAALRARALAVLSDALRLRALLALALEDDGGAVSSWEATRRADVLRRLDGVARHAVAAATNSPLERRR
jgi:hypothetical protein